MPGSEVAVAEPRAPIGDGVEDGAMDREWTISTQHHRESAALSARSMHDRHFETDAQQTERPTVRDAILPLLSYLLKDRRNESQGEAERRGGQRT